ncbi:hypothetical protein NIES3974_25920 [Calothrix sp. NIES-3974]|nr:hypothetical protein NIES3974_25920 [Calothrix sp. NIES-3974]
MYRDLSGFDATDILVKVSSQTPRGCSESVKKYFINHLLKTGNSLKRYICRYKLLPTPKKTSLLSIKIDFENIL